MTQLANSSSDLSISTESNPIYQTRVPMFTVTNQGRWRQYDGNLLNGNALPFDRITAISTRTNAQGVGFLRVDLTCNGVIYAIENRCSPNEEGLLPTRAHSLIQGLLGLNALNGTLANVPGLCVAAMGSKPSPDGFPGIFINVSDMSDGYARRVPSKLLDRDLSTGMFDQAVLMLKAQVRGF